MSIERSDLPSGLKVVTERVPGARSASFGVWVRVGSRDEPTELAGVSHFLEHLLFKGTRTRSGREISEMIEAVGGELNAHTSHEHTAFYTRVPAEAAALGLDLLVDVVTSPAFDGADVESERQVITEELHQSEDEGADRVMSLAHEILWGGHPLGREVLGTEETISSMSRDALAAFFDDHYHPDNLVVVAAGAVEHRQVVDAVSRLEPRPGHERPVRSEPCALGSPGGPTVLRRQLEQAHLAVVWPGLAVGDPDRYALAVANQILGGGLSSRLFQTIREERGLVYTVFSAVAAYSDAGSVVAYAGTSPDRVSQVRKLIADEVARAIDGGTTVREWEVARGYLRGASLLGSEDPGSVMGRLGSQMCARGSVGPLERQLARLDAVTVDDVDRVLRRVLGAEPLVVGVGSVEASDLVG